MSINTIPVSTLGTPRIGPRRELKFALERYWAGGSDEAALCRTAAELRAANWTRQLSRGVTKIPSNDFSFYDHVLDTSVMVGAVPEAYGWTDGLVALDTYFAMARGSQGRSSDLACSTHDGGGEHGTPAQEMTKWFDTNYHYMVPEFSPGQTFYLGSTKPMNEFHEAATLGFTTRPVLLGPVTYLKLGKPAQGDFDPLTLLDAVLPVYIEVLSQLRKLGADWVQMDEPCLVLDLTEGDRRALRHAYQKISQAVPSLKIMLTPYFGALGDNLKTALSLPVAGLHLDLVRAPDQFDTVLTSVPAGLVLSLGIIDGRNVWRADLNSILDWLEPVVAKRGLEWLELAPSCSLLHTPIDLALETDLDPIVSSWLAFSVQKMDELATLAIALSKGRDAARDSLDASAEAARMRRESPKVHNPAIAARMATISPEMVHRSVPFARRRELQRKALHLPPLPTTTIGSFPQTAEVRKARAAHARGDASEQDYTGFLRKQTEAAIRWQEEIGLDVLVHGEFERNDMVQYFGERLSGFAFTKHAWVQSYGSRYVRPPILYGDVSRPKPMTVEWWSYAQSLTDKPVKGMLTGPVTILNWSFVRDDIPESAACRQVALAIRDEVADLEAAGAAIIQIDEAALREGLPLRHAEWDTYLNWAVECFCLCASGVKAETQIHTHMCYSEFNDIIEAIAAMDADVVSIETSRSKMELLDAFRNYRYPNEIGPGVYDIHSPRVPETGEIIGLLTMARERLADEQLWVNPDCGLKTRRWEEVRPALINMVKAARQLRTELR